MRMKTSTKILGEIFRRAIIKEDSDITFEDFNDRNVTKINTTVIKHITIRYHFIRKYVIECILEMHFVTIYYKLPNIFTTPLYEATFTRLVNELRMILQNFSNSDK